MTRNGMSQRGHANVESIMPKISKQVEERKKKAADSKLDLSTSENFLIRPELMRIYKNAIGDGLESSVRRTAMPFTMSVC